jgi:hypothetical protein
MLLSSFGSVAEETSIVSSIPRKGGLEVASQVKGIIKYAKLKLASNTFMEGTTYETSSRYGRGDQ